MKELSFLKDSLIAHRGYHTKTIPENSIKAFSKAIDNNLIIELDVHLLKDNNIVVFHDDNLKRMTNVDKYLKDLTYDDIKDLKLLNTNNKIPLLKDVLKLVDSKVPLIIELKYDRKYGLLESELIKELKNYKGLYAIKSFNPLSLYYFKKHSKNTIRGQLVTSFKNKKMNKLKKIFLRNMFLNFITKPDFISCDIRYIRNKKIQKLRKKKIVLGWTIKSIDDYDKIKNYCDNYICENVNFKKIGD